MWDKTYGCTKQYRCSIAYYQIYFLSKSYKVVLDVAVDTPGHGKDVVGGFDTVQKQYLATCLRIRSTPEVYKIDNNCILADTMTKKGEVSFSE